MFFATFEYANEEAARAELFRLWDKSQLRGEMAIKPAGDGRFYLEMCLEKDLTTAQIEKMQGRRL